ncbi:DUF3168 domain-containing protein [Rhizobium halophytocola]|uniref:DUF3168 domain-containing protein n=1 Tax=Rhizobium halophytocola TaxID=735519 RepID=A0ABS4DYZ6_9HYPH|nr:DUF3168 domain-containing protein [Rhizobium halophytocola]MBP1850908.1 hypothetical protein [Rhizobium halophytocola]
MSDPVNAVLTAIHARLTADADLQGLVGASIFDRRPEARILPCLVTGAVETRQIGADGGGVSEILLTYEAWASGRRAAEAIAAALRAALSQADLSLGARGPVSLDHRRTSSRRAAKSAYFLAETQFRVVVED